MGDFCLQLNHFNPVLEKLEKEILVMNLTYMMGFQALSIMHYTKITLDDTTHPSSLIHIIQNLTILKFPIAQEIIVALYYCKAGIIAANFQIFPPEPLPCLIFAYFRNVFFSFWAYNLGAFNA